MTKKELGMLLGAQVDRARLAQGWSVRGLAREADVPQTPVLRLCQGESTQASVYLLLRVADVLGLSLDALVGREVGV